MVTLTMILGLSSEKQLVQQCNLINKGWTKVIFSFDVNDLNIR
jgi:hypothetical protein